MVITDFEIAQASIELVCGFVSAMLAVIVLINHHEQASIRQIVKMLFNACALLGFEAFTYIFRGNTDTLRLIMTRISNFSVFFLNILLTYVSMGYFYSVLRERGVTPGDIYRKIVRSCVWAAVAILAVNQFTGWMYTFDASNYYHRNWLWYGYTGLFLVCLLTSCAMVIRYYRALDRLNRICLLLYTLFPILAIAIQTLFYGISIINIGIGVCILLMLMAYLIRWNQTDTADNANTGQIRRTYENTILLIIMLVSMTGSIVGCIFSIRRSAVEISVSNSQIVAHIVSDRLENTFLRPITVTETMASDNSLRKYMKQSNAQDDEQVEADMAAYLESIRSGFDYQMVYAVCEESRSYYTYNGFVKHVDPSSDPTDAWYGDFLASGERFTVQVDTDAANHWGWSFFVNREVRGEDGRLLGVCGVGLELTQVQQMLSDFEEQYGLRITLADKSGRAMVTSRDVRIGRNMLDEAQNIASETFTIQERDGITCMTKGMGEMNWCLIVEDLTPQRINVAKVLIPNLAVSLAGLFLLAVAFCVMTIRERKIAQELIEKRRTSLTDELTGLGNRRALQQDCQRLAEAGKLGKLTVVEMDLNELKRYNDTLGQQAGDELIRGTAQCMLQSMQGSGKLYRTGGDEFVAVLDCDSETLEAVLAEFDRLAAQWQGEHIRTISASRGVVRCGEFPGLSLLEILDMADRRMYENKREYYRNREKLPRDARVE